jgi:hypothetical protein
MRQLRATRSQKLVVIIPSILSWYISPYFSASNWNERMGNSLSRAVTFPRNGIAGGCGMGVVITRLSDTFTGTGSSRDAILKAQGIHEMAHMLMSSNFS